MSLNFWFFNWDILDDSSIDFLIKPLIKLETDLAFSKIPSHYEIHLRYFAAASSNNLNHFKITLM